MIKDLQILNDMLRSREAVSPKAEDSLRALLACIHRDTGHYQDTYGTNQAVMDAVAVILKYHRYYDQEPV